MSRTMGKVGAVAGTMILAGSGMFVALPAMADEAASPTGAEAAAVASPQEGAAGQEDGAVPQKVEGAFSYTQESVSDNGTIANVFSKAMATLCAGMPNYAVQEVQAIVVRGASSLEATVDEMASEEGSQSYTIGCACASNVAGGGAIVNAEVSGVSLASVAQRVGAL